MKILAVHNYHRKGSASGDDQVFRSETDLLEAHGHNVIRYTVSNDEFDTASAFGKLRATLGMFWSIKNYRAIRDICQREQPEIVHIHTFFPLLSPSVLYAARKSGCKVIATLHDTRFVCPCATSLRNIQICNECKDGKYFRMCKYKCFKNSHVQSFVVACIFKIHRVMGSFYKQIDRYICLNNSQIELLKSVGFDQNKIHKKFNFVIEAKVKTGLVKGLPERYVVFYGRIGEEKGIRNLIEIWNKLDIPLVIMGGGPMEKELKAWAESKNNIYYLGYMEHGKCLSIVKGAEFVVFPSIWYEGCSMVVIESESLGKGVIATDLGFSSEAINNEVNGIKVPVGDNNEFRTQILKLWNDPEKCKKIGQNAKKDYLQKYLPEDNYKQLLRIYEGV